MVCIGGGVGGFLRYHLTKKEKAKARKLNTYHELDLQQSGLVG